MKKILSLTATFLALPGLFCLGPLGTAETLADAIEGTRPFYHVFPWVIYFGLSAWWMIHISHTTNHQ